MEYTPIGDVVDLADLAQQVDYRLGEMAEGFEADHVGIVVPRENTASGKPARLTVQEVLLPLMGQASPTSSAKLIDAEAVLGGTQWVDLTDGGNTLLHIHDSRYYTETESDARFINASGDTMTGILKFQSAGADPYIYVPSTGYIQMTSGSSYVKVGSSTVAHVATAGVSSTAPQISFTATDAILDSVVFSSGHDDRRLQVQFRRVTLDDGLLLGIVAANDQYLTGSVKGDVTFRVGTAKTHHFGVDGGTNTGAELKIADDQVTVTGGLAVSKSVTAPNFYVPDGGSVGISGNELLTFNAAGNITVSGADMLFAGTNKAIFEVAGQEIYAGATGYLDIASPTGIRLDGTTLHVDCVNNRVGIGTATPLYALHMKAAAWTLGAMEWTDTTTGAGFFFVEDGTSIGSLQSTGSTHAFVSWRELTALTSQIENTGRVGFITREDVTAPNTWHVQFLVENNGDIVIGDGLAGRNYQITFDGATNDGILTWFDADYFQFSDDILMSAAEHVYFRDAGIHISSAADSYLDIIADGCVRINTNAWFEADGTRVASGAATTFNDIFLPFEGTHVPAANNPTWTTWIGGTGAYVFAVNDYLDLQSTELMHTYLEDSNFEFHVHWCTNGVEGAAKYVKWEIEFSIANSAISGAVGDTFPATTVLTAETEIPASTPDRKNMYTTFAPVTGTNFKMGAILKVKARRIASAGAAPLANPFGLMAGIHIEQDTDGSRTQRTK